METQLISIKDACAVLSLGRRKIYELLDGGKLKSTKVGTKRLITTESVREFVDSLPVGG